MRSILGVLLLITAVIFNGSTVAAECTQRDKVVFATWPHYLGTLTAYIAVTKGFFEEQCLIVDLTIFKESSHFDTTLQRGVKGAVYVSNYVTLLTTNLNRYFDTNDGERAYIVGYVGDAMYGIYGKKGVPLGVGSKIAIFRCGWNNRDLTEPLDVSKRDESLSIMLLNVLPWLREHYGSQMGIWCGAEPPEGFQGIHLVPVGHGSKRQRAQFDENGIDFAIHAIERGITFIIGDDAVLDLVVGPEELRKTPEVALIAAESCVNDEQCRDVLKRLNTGLEAARVWIHNGGITRVEEVLIQYATEAQEGSIKNINTASAKLIAPYVLEHLVSERRLRRKAIEQLIEDNELPVKPEDIVDERLVKMY